MPVNMSALQVAVPGNSDNKQVTITEKVVYRDI